MKQFINLARNLHVQNNNKLHFGILLLCLCFMPIGCAKKSASSKKLKKESPAKVEHAVPETEIAYVKLTESAEKRLGITLVAVEKKNVQRQRTFGGETMIPPGNSVIVSTPLSGTLSIPNKSKEPVAGNHVQVGQPIFSLAPLLSPERYVPTPAERVSMANAKASLVSSQIVADGDMKRAKAELEAAQIVLTRAKQLLKDRAGSVKAVDDAKARYNQAEKTLEAASNRKTVLDKLTLSSKADQAKPFMIAAPSQGVLQTISVKSGQVVTAGDPLFTITNLIKLWIRVPVYSGILSSIDTTKVAGIGSLSTKSKDNKLQAKPIAAPPTANALSSTIDLYYELDNKDQPFRPGERVGVTLALNDQAENLVIPWAAVLHDIHGGTWVYVKIEEHVYQRYRIQIRYTLDKIAILESGPQVGSQIVVDGAAEIFGTEFGTKK